MSRTGSLLVASAAVSMVLVAACAKIVGITDTVVEPLDTGSDAGVSSPRGSAGASTNVSLAGSGGGGGSTSAVSSAAGGAGSGGMPALMSMDAGPPLADAASLGCEQAARCGAEGREVCSAGAWQPQPCPLGQPACEGAGQCVVRGPALVSVGNFFVQATEVTVAQYGQFLTAKGSDVSGQSDVCSWNEAYWDYELRPVMEPAEMPIAWVDWCDAAAYCSWAGMHLCGRIGGGPIARADVLDATRNQWFVACGGPGGSAYPNDMANNIDACSSGPYGDVAPVATHPLCEGYFPGIFDMAGNLAEWIDGCDGNTGAADTCYLMGGNITEQTPACNLVYYNTDSSYPRSQTAFTFGFRCCSG
ncbi:MAG TPA: SUMF1/EgtB/PvdO family nonheme iron enzyme [Polyangiaceae bacterium]|nr:SUMF1/EgtB/PvdO family nonheme iron enzyme [Polyangiaceae bacterium]